jgi:hypothetical protein
VRSPRAVPWEASLPWAPLTIKQSAIVVPVRAARVRGFVCAKAADGSTSRDVGTSVTARIRNASVKSAVGRRRGGKPTSPGCRGQSSPCGGSAHAPPARQVHAPNTEGTRGCGGAWSRGEKFFRLPVCARPGCHEAPLHSIRNPACYCSAACRQAVRNVLDRERKWQSRNTLNGRRKRAYEYRAARGQRSRRQGNASGAASSKPPPA